MTRRASTPATRAMTLIEVLAATAMLAIIASALIGFGATTLPTVSTSDDPLSVATRTDRLAELRALDADQIETSLNPGEQLTQIDSAIPKSEEPSPGQWLTVQTDGWLVVRWMPTPRDDEREPEVRP